jgi:pimeloyl-ACP methyl ester carboxylesterase
MGAPWNMHFLAKNIRRDGWHVVNWKYPSREAFISEHAEQLVKDLIHLSHSNPGKPIHFVTHSMGGLVLLSALNHPNCPNEGKTGKVVLIAPPIKGSSWGRWAGQFSAIKSIVKNFSGQELITETNFEHFGNFPDSLEKILVISGNFGMNPLLSEPNDGTLAISETRPSTPHEHLIVKSGHKSIIFSKQVCRSTLHFLRP